jgi:hypothetical protein
MGSPVSNRQRREYQRRKRNLQHGWSHALKWAILSYGFISVYGALYGSAPTLVHRLGMTLAVLSGCIAAVFGAFWVVVTVSAVVRRWMQRHGRADYG